MIKQWRLTGFKSVKDHKALEFSPLTVFCGANSAGKSTIIQSILLTAQTMQSQVSNRSVVINGNLVRLGSFSDIASHGGDKKISIGFELAETPYAEQLEDVHQGGTFSSYLWGNENTKRVFCEFVLAEGAFGEAGKGKVEVSRCRFEVDSVTENDVSQSYRLEIVRRESTVDEHIQSLGVTPEEKIRRELSQVEHVEQRENDNNSQPLTRSHEKKVPSNARTFGIGLYHFLPIMHFYIYDRVESEASTVFEALSGAQAGSETANAISPEIQKIVLGILDQTKHLVDPNRLTSPLVALESIKADFNLRKLWLYLRNNSQALRLEYTTKLEAAKNDIKTLARNGRAPDYRVMRQHISDGVGSAGRRIHEFFTVCLKYLGPLRDEPKSIYPLAGSADQNDIGLKGENTAAVLDTHADDLIFYISPDDIGSRNPTPRPRRASLREATLEWIRYVGVADDVRTSDRGNLGHELRVVAADGLASHDLTHVGVGVSQILPILVQSLLAAPGSTLIFEQPELHLHPRVQTRLADFFICMIKIGKQCVVETHSEYFVNRLRYLSASSSGSEISKNVGLYFVTKERDQSSYRKVIINEYGVISEWPSGFFDESERVSQDIMEAGIEKRRRLHSGEV